MKYRDYNRTSAHPTNQRAFFGNNRENKFFNENKTFFSPQSNPPSTIQTQLMVNQPADKYEIEADSVANAAIDGEKKAPVVQHKMNAAIQRKCKGREESENQIQKKAESSDNTATASLSTQIINASGKGNPLPSGTLAEMNSSFGADFSRVHIHEDENSARMNNELNAQAFTFGDDVYFNSGKYNPGNNNGKRLLAHELTHTLQQQSSVQRIQREPADSSSVEACMKQGTELLPGKVGMVEHINREVALDEILGKERKNFEDQIRQDNKAREFVCEAGVGAMMALFYNRDFKNRLNVDVARQSFTEHPEYYSIGGFDTTKQAKQLLKKKYNIFIEPGDKEWSPDDIVLLTQALSKLDEKEMPLISNYHFIRWTNRCNELTAKDPDHECSLEEYAVCGFHETDIVDRKYTIKMYDCMRGATDEKIRLGTDVKSGADTIIHEIGHAMEYGRLRLALEEASDAKKEYERIKRELDSAKTADAKASISKKLKVAEKTKNDADKKVSKIFSTPSLETFKKLISGKPPLTPYASTNLKEAFAEAFMIFKVDPEKLKKANKPLFKWFNEGGFI